MRKHRQRTTWGTGMNPTGRYEHMFEGKVRKKFIQNNRDPYKEEIKIPPPYPHKRKNINYFRHSKGSIFSLLSPFFIRLQINLQQTTGEQKKTSQLINAAR